jgi:hypothetical protein
MPPSNPSLVKIILDGGIMMVPFILLVIAWIVLTIRFVVMRPRTTMGLVRLILFPLAFGILAIAHWAFHWNMIYEEMEMAGWPHVVQHTQRVLVISRSCLAIVSVAGLSLLSVVGMSALRLEEKNPTNKAQHPTA